MRPKPYSPDCCKLLKESLRHLEDVRTVSPDDPTLKKLKETLRAKIAELELAQLAEETTH